MTQTRTRLLIALGATLTLVALAWACPPDGDNRGPAVLSILGKWHLLALHLPAALLLALPAVEWLNPAEEASRPVRHLADLAGAGTWAATALGILHGHFNGFEGSDVEQHLRLGVVAAALAALAWAMMGSNRRTRLALQGLALLGTVLAAHIGGEMVHDEGFLTTPSVTEKPSSLAEPPSRGFSLFPSAQAAENPDTAGFAPNAENEVLAKALERELPVRVYTRSNKNSWGLNVHQTGDIPFGNAEFAKLAERGGPQVAVLALDGTQLTDGCADKLSSFTRLMLLGLGGTQVGDPMAEAIVAKLPTLRVLGLTGTRITDKGLAALARCQNLEELYLDKTACTPEGIAAFCKAKPKALVIKDGKFYGNTTVVGGR